MTNGFERLDLDVDGLTHKYEVRWKLLPPTDRPVLLNPRPEGQPCGLRRYSSALVSHRAAFDALGLPDHR
jgi:hypothetical protein